MSLPNVLDWKQLTLLQVALGAALGTYSHIVLDSIMHADIRPLAPISDGNSLLHLVSLEVLHLACLVLGGVGGLAVLLRSRLGKQR